MDSVQPQEARRRPKEKACRAETKRTAVELSKFEQRGNNWQAHTGLFLTSIVPSRSRASSWTPASRSRHRARFTARPAAASSLFSMAWTTSCLTAASRETVSACSRARTLGEKCMPEGVYIIGTAPQRSVISQSWCV